MAAREQTGPQAGARYKYGHFRQEALIARLNASEIYAPPNSLALEALLSASHHLTPGHHFLASKPGLVSDLLRETDRVQLLIRAQAEELWAHLLDVITSIKAAGQEIIKGPCTTGSAATDSLPSLHAALQSIGEELVALHAFKDASVAACAHVAQQIDGQEQEGGAVQLAYASAAAGQHLLGGLSLDPLMVALSDAYELLHVVHGNLYALLHHSGSSQRWVAPDEFRRVTRKFWLRPVDVPKFKAEVVKQLPILIYGEREKLTEVDTAVVWPALQDQTVRDSAAIASIYYDNVQDLPSYHDRLRRVDHATSVRVRWYGERSLNPDQQLFVERKVHRQSNTGEASIKERAAIKQSSIAAFTAGYSSIPEMQEGAKKAGFLAETQHHMKELGMKPLLRTSYHRTAFQHSSDNLIRISLDTDLVMIKEDNAPKMPGNWCRNTNLPLPASDVVNFPYAVVEIKMQQEPPAWVEHLVQSGLLIAVPKFSKFLHGAAVMFQDKVENTPHWFLPDEVNPSLMTPATWEEMADPSDQYIKDAAQWLFPSGFEEPLPAPQPVRRGLLGMLPRGRNQPIPVPQPEVVPVRQEQYVVLDLDALQNHLGTQPQSNSTPDRTGRSTPVDSAEDIETGHAGVSPRPRAQRWQGMQSRKVFSYGNGALPGVDIDAHGGPGGISKDHNGVAAKAATSNNSSRAAAMVRTRVEPKTFFANERTFLQWLQISVLVMFTALSLLSGSSVSMVSGSGGTTSCANDSKCWTSKVAGAIIAPAGLLFMAYALYMYKKRTIQIMRRETVRYDDQRGPVVLVVVLLIVMSLAYILSLVYIS